MTESTQGASPKSPRYFYTDPLAAAWMAKHFGMRFTAWNGKSRAYNEIQVLPLIDSENHYQRLVHRESLPLLEPQEGDLVQREDGIARLVTHVKPDHPAINGGSGVALYYDNPHIRGQAWIDKAAVDIIQRNGIAFHWPEREAA